MKTHFFCSVNFSEIMAGKKEGEEPGGRNRQQEEKGGRRKETVRGERFGIVSRAGFGK